MAICSHCGRQSQPNALNCEFCGSPLSAQESDITGQDTVFTSPQASNGQNGAQASDALAKVIVRPLHDSSEHPREYALTGQTISIGRSPSCEIVLEHDQLTSRRHALLRYDGARYTVVDLGSSNGTFVNDAEIRDAMPLTYGDRIIVGEHELTFSSSVAGEAPVASVDLDGAPPSSPLDITRAPSAVKQDESQATPEVDAVSGMATSADEVDTGYMATVVTPMEAPPEAVADVSNVSDVAAGAESVAVADVSNVSDVADVTDVSEVSDVSDVESAEEADISEEAGVAGGSDVTDVTDVTDVADVADVTDVADVADVTDVADVADVADMADVADISDGPHEPATVENPSDAASDVTERPTADLPAQSATPDGMPSLLAHAPSSGALRQPGGELDQLREQMRQLVATSEVVAQHAVEETELSERRRQVLAETRDQLHAILAGIQHTSGRMSDGESDDVHDLSDLIALSQQAAADPNHLQNVSRLAEHASEIVRALEVLQTHRIQPPRPLTDENALAELRALQARLDDLA